MKAMSTTYRPLPRGRLLVTAGIILVWLVAFSAGGAAGLVAGTVALVAAVALTWLFGTRFAHTVTVDGTDLRWRGILRHGHLDVTTMRRVRPAHFEKTMLVLEGPRGRGPFVAGGTGLAAFVDALRAARPDLPVELGRWAGRLEALDRDTSTGVNPPE